MAIKMSVEERRHAGRVDLQGRVELVIAHRPTMSGNSLNLSEGGLCVRVEEPLDVKAPVTLKFFAQPRSRPVKCAGRVAWVVQRLDLRAAPPFLYDVGVEFVRTSARLRQVGSRLGVLIRAAGERAPANVVAAGKLVKHSSLQPIPAHGRYYEPRLIHEFGTQSSWHLVVKADGAPCFSHRYESEREALAGWKQFKRQLGKGKRGR